MKKVAIVNDCSDLGHFGCIMVTEAIKMHLRMAGAEIVGIVPWGRGRTQIKEYPDFLDDADLVIVNGEGSIHHNYRSHDLLEVPNRWPAVLINAVYDGNTTHGNLHKYKAIYVRETLSKVAVEDALKGKGPAVTVCPDVIYSHSALSPAAVARLKDVKIGGRLLLTDGMRDRYVGSMISVNTPYEDYIRTMAGYKKVCTGRFHGIALAACLGKPFTCWESNTHKNQGICGDMKTPEIFFKSAKEAIPAANAVTFNPYIADYVMTAPMQIERMFDDILDLA
jgi:hypothetical protein